MSAAGWTHSLSMVVRYNNHFTGAPVPDELPVRLDGSYVGPVMRGDRTGSRQSDGTYRFIDLQPGTHLVRWMPPFVQSHAGWISWEPDLEVLLPAADPKAIFERDLWPTSAAAVPPAMTAIRGKLTGAALPDPVAGTEVRVAPQAGPFPTYTLVDAVGEFLFLLPRPVAPQADGKIRLRIQVAGGAHAVTGGTSSGSGASFVGDQFDVEPGQSHRVVFAVS